MTTANQPDRHLDRNFLPFFCDHDLGLDSTIDGPLVSILVNQPSWKATGMLTADHPIDDNRLDETFAALANPTRRAILARLAQGEATVNELAAPFDMTLPAISKHIKVLERAGLIGRSRHAQFRPCRLDPAPLADVAGWAEQYRPIWEERFDRLADYLEHIQPPPQGSEP
jgi:DNA-binding transcriptional ArsR family regulator